MKATIEFDCANLSKQEIDQLFKKYVHLAEVSDKQTTALSEKREQETEAKGQIIIFENLLY